MDNDRLLGPGFAAAVVKTFCEEISYLQLSNTYTPGTCGTIGMETDVFTSLGGYNEQFLPEGIQGYQ